MRILVWLLVCLSSHSFAMNRPLPSELNFFALGSCNKQYLPQVHWKLIQKQNPDLWLWLGDNYYGDTKDMQELRKISLQVKKHPDYVQLRETTPIIGIWDDHDYGDGNGNDKWKYKAEAQKILLDFLDEAPDSPRRRQKGIYTSYTLGSQGKRVKFILLDTRYFKSKHFPRDILGEAQWRWLERTLSEDPAEITFIASGVGVIQRSWETFGIEGWRSFKKSQKRLRDLLKKTHAKGVFFLSGDRHFSALYEGKFRGGDRQYVEFMSSGLTHFKSPGTFASRYYDPQLTYGERSFGTVEIDWSQRPAQVTFRIVNLENRVVVKKTYPAI